MANMHDMQVLRRQDVTNSGVINVVGVHDVSEQGTKLALDPTCSTVYSWGASSWVEPSKGSSQQLRRAIALFDRFDLHTYSRSALSDLSDVRSDAQSVKEKTTNLELYSQNRQYTVAGTI